MRKKIILLIVEGVTDKICLELSLSRILNNKERNINFQVVGGDITSNKTSTVANIPNKICEVVKFHAGKIFKPNNYLKVVHLVDLDGTFIDDADVEEAKEFEAPFYAIDKIKTAYVEDIRRRNQHKRSIINRMITLPLIWGSIPYEVYYFSCNLDHVLHDNANLNNDEKSICAGRFERCCAEDNTFLPKVLGAENILLGNSYMQSWDLVKHGRESLNRHSNLYFFLKNFCLKLN